MNGAGNIEPTPPGVGFAVRGGEDGGHGVLVVIPARYGSSRFPGKALADLHGLPLIVRVAANARRVRLADRVLVATDDERIRDAVLAAGHECEMTAAHRTGTDRIAEVARRHRAGLVRTAYCFNAPLHQNGATASNTLTMDKTNPAR